VRKIDGRNVRVCKLDTAERCWKLVASFLATTEREGALMEQLFARLYAKYNRCLTSAEIGAFRRQHSVPKATLHVLLTQMEKAEVIRKAPWAGHDGEFLYYLHDGFSKALFRTLKAYRRMLPAKKKDVRAHPAFSKAVEC